MNLASKSAFERGRKWRRYNFLRVYKNEILLCPKCGSNNINKHGQRYNLYRKINVFRCNSCLKVFSKNPIEFDKWKHFPDSLKDYIKKSKLSNRETAKDIQEDFGIPISHSTIGRWKKGGKYGI